MFTLALLLLGLAIVLAQVYASAGRPLPTTEAIPLTALGLTWRHHKNVVTRRGDRSLWFGHGDATTYRHAYEVGREPLDRAGYSFTNAIIDRVSVSHMPCCWEPVPADEAASEAAIAAAEAAVARHAEEVEFYGTARADDMEALRTSLDTLYWAWPTKKKAIADALLAEPVRPDGYPSVESAKMAVTLVRQVREAVAKVRERIARDPAHDWLAQAQEPGVLQAVHVGVKILCGFDEDRASIRNDAGWGKSHTHVGHVLGALTTLSVIEGSQALAAVWRHRRQLRPDLREAIFGSAEA